jgi:hypothetical protein
LASIRKAKGKKKECWEKMNRLMVKRDTNKKREARIRKLPILSPPFF